jgi:hypothetical protein
MRIAAPPAALALLSLVLLGPTPCFVAPAYPTDSCVSLKLAAAADYCATALQGQQTPDSAAALDSAWANAEGLAAEAGVDCTETTVTSAGMAALLDANSQVVRTGLLTLIEGPPLCSEDLFDATAQYCADRLEAYANHLVRRVRDRSRLGLEIDNDHAAERHSARLAELTGSGCSIGTTALGVQGVADVLVREAAAAATISPAVATEWTAVVPDGPVAYGDRIWEASCWDGAPYRFFVKKGTVNKLLVNYEGGGACWDIFTCGLNPTFKQDVLDDASPGSFPFGFADDDNPQNPFKDWHKVYVPYCTGDIHWGDATVEHQQLDEQGNVSNSVTVRHWGFRNTRVVEKWTREHFVDPELVFVTGSSAGAYGAIGNSAWLMEKVYPSTEFAVLGDAGNGVVTQDFTANEISKWGIETLLPDWIPELNVDVSELDAADLYAAAANTYPDNRFATFTSAYDGGSGGQTGFYHIMLNPGAIFLWPQWWNSSCAWREGMEALNADAVARAPNYRFYVGAGTGHTTFFRDRVYTETTGGIPTVASWVSAMVNDSPAWRNVSCGDDCGVLLEGDPEPDPPVPPFTANGLIDCMPGMDDGGGPMPPFPFE